MGMHWFKNPTPGASGQQKREVPRQQSGPRNLEGGGGRRRDKSVHFVHDTPTRDRSLPLSLQLG